MKRLELISKMGLMFFCLLVSLTQVNAGNAKNRAMKPNELLGKQYFEGTRSLSKGGPSCISCHSVTHDKVAKGGFLAKDLTDVYTRLGEGISAWLSAPPFPAMASSYQNNPLTEKERNSLQAFFAYTNEVKSFHQPDLGYDIMLIGGLSGLIGILVLINVLWFVRKRNMVKKEIFARQSRAWDAKH